MKLLVCGSRDYADYETLALTLDAFDHYDPVTLVIEGCATGADSLGERWATERSIPIDHHPADWDRYGKSAGPIRNREMADEAPDLVVAFYSDRANPSRGTANMVATARQRGIDVVIQ